jgi:hypothetical protein
LSRPNVRSLIFCKLFLTRDECGVTTACEVSRQPCLPSSKRRVDDQRTQRPACESKLLGIAGNIFFSVGVTLPCDICWYFCFDFAPYLNLAPYVPLGSVLMRLVGSGVVWRLVLVFNSATLPETLTPNGSGAPRAQGYLTPRTSTLKPKNGHQPIAPKKGFDHFDSKCVIS